MVIYAKDHGEYLKILYWGIEGSGKNTAGDVFWG